MNEKLLEKKLREGVKKLGGLALKFTSTTYTGMPDRIVLMPGEKTYWVELKSEGESRTPIQKKAHNILLDLGYFVITIDSPEKLSNFLEHISR